MTHVFIVGSKGIPAQYGGFETFVENLTAGKQSKELKYHVSCMNNDENISSTMMQTALMFAFRYPAPPDVFSMWVWF